jgi:hypothetical protein
MEKRPRAGDGGGGGGGEASGTLGGGLVDTLPEALLVEVVGRVGLEAACSAAASCRALRGAAGAALSAVTSLDLSVSLPPPLSRSSPPARCFPLNAAVWSLCCRCSRRRTLS